jgi:hypothetical protein
MVEKIVHDQIIYAIIIRASYNKEGIEFFSEENYSQQLGYMKRPAGYIIEPHRHNIVSREVLYTQETLFIRQGKIRVDFYNQHNNIIKNTLLFKDDVILLINGGHGFEILEESEIIEVKQGPYIGHLDKERFKLNNNE